jgi:hypothetical protein
MVMTLRMRMISSEPAPTQRPRLQLRLPMNVLVESASPDFLENISAGRHGFRQMNP